MRTHLLPGTDLRVSALCLGAGRFGSALAVDAVDRLVSAFLQAGGNFFDTAHCYAFWAEGGLGASERALGESLRRLGALDRAIIGTKGGHPDGGEGYCRPDHYLAPEVIAGDVADSLERLGLDRIALYYLHRDDTRVPVGEIIDALNDQVRLGRLTWLGASNWSTARLREANAYAEGHGLRGFAISQVQWSLATPTWEMGPDPTMRYVRAADAVEYAAMGLPVAAYGATACGYFAGAGGGFDMPANEARRERARSLARELGCTPTQVALAWLLHQEVTTIPITGTSSPAHLAEAVGAFELSLSAEQVGWLRGDDE